MAEQQNDIFLVQVTAGTGRSNSTAVSQREEGGGGGGRKRTCCYIILRGGTAVETKATLKVVRTRVKYVLTYSKIKNACNPLFVTMNTSCKLSFKKDNTL